MIRNTDPTPCLHCGHPLYPRHGWRKQECPKDATGKKRTTTFTAKKQAVATAEVTK